MYQRATQKRKKKKEEGKEITLDAQDEHGKGRRADDVKAGRSRLKRKEERERR